MLPPSGSPLPYTRWMTVRGTSEMVRSGSSVISTGYSQVVGWTVAWAHHDPGGQGSCSSGEGQ